MNKSIVQERQASPLNPHALRLEDLARILSAATTKAGKMPALQRASGLNAVRESGSAGVPPARPGARASRPQITKAARSPVNGA